MKKNRRDFLKKTGLAGLGMVSVNMMKTYASVQNSTQNGNKVTVDYAVATMEDGRIISTPFWRVDSGKDGPSLAIVAAQHGNEVQGAEVARRFMEFCAVKLMSGSVWLIPMANILAVRSRRHSFDLEPEQDNAANPNKYHNMQRHWPGNPDGNDTARLAYSVDQKVLRHCTHMVDIHCWEHIKAAQALSEEIHEPSRSMGDVTTTRFISYRNTSIPQSETMMISQMMLKRGAGVHVMELAGQFQMLERQVQIGLSSLINIAKLLGVIEGEPVLIDGKRAVRTPEATIEVMAPCSGLFVAALTNNQTRMLGADDYVDEGQKIGHIIKENDLETIPVIATASGYLWQLGLCHWGLCDASLPAQHPYTEEGEKIAAIIVV